jgi:hypothetical protein
VVHSLRSGNTEFGRKTDVRSKYVPIPLQWCDKPNGNDLTRQGIRARGKQKVLATKMNSDGGDETLCTTNYTKKRIVNYKRFAKGKKGTVK